MLPQQSLNINDYTEPQLSPSLTFRVDMINDMIAGFTDEQTALAQAIFMMIMTEKGFYEIFPKDYGLQTHDLIGKPFPYVRATLKGRVKACLLTDLRIKSVNSIEIEEFENQARIFITVDTVFGEVQTEAEVDLNGAR